MTFGEDAKSVGGEIASGGIAKSGNGAVKVWNAAMQAVGTLESSLSGPTGSR